MQFFTYNALHMSMLPLVHMNLVQRLVRVDLLFVVVTVCEELSVPYIPLPSLLLFLDGKPMENKRHESLLFEYLTKCHDDGLFQADDGEIVNGMFILYEA